MLKIGDFIGGTELGIRRARKHAGGAGHATGAADIDGVLARQRCHRHPARHSGQSTPKWAVPYLVVTAVPWAALQVWAALELLRGAGWARTVLTVLAALSVLGAPLDLSGLILAGLALTISGAVLMWRPAANPFLRQG